MAESTNREKDIFLQALDLTSTAERDAFLAQACGADEGLRRQLDAMLQAHASPDSFLEKPAAAMEITVDVSDRTASADRILNVDPGTRIGPYKLLEQIGEGGMGVVYVAEQQEPVRRIVALKIIKPGMDSGQVLARFEAERQALALMDHPNIAKVLDAGTTTDGRPFFVMELVKGTPITTFCDANKLTPRQRLELFVPVCQAIQHAHQKGVIHRDIKPSNVLIALYDDKPVPKVIDFGIAKATGNALTERTLHTGFGAIVGTPEYMSPEQATFNQLDIDTRSDVYSLGVLLYELLAGSTPVDKTRLKKAAILEVLRVVREEEPARPSVKLSTTAARASIAAMRGTEPAKLAQLLRGELDWIVMRSLEKDRSRRYETAAGLARDVDRYLRDELVEARPPSAGYRLRKSVKRHRGKVLAASLLFLALLGGVIGTTVGMVRARNAETTAEDNRKVAEIRRDQAIQAEKEADDQARKAQAQARRADMARHALLIEQAMRSWENQDTGEAIRYLDKVLPEFRQTWETRYLRDLCRRKFRPFPMPADESLEWVAPSNDGQWLVGWNNAEREAIQLLDARTGKTRFKFQSSTHECSFSHNAKWLLAAGSFAPKEKWLGQAKVFDLETGDERFALTDLPGGVWGRDVSADDSRIALGCLDKLLVCDSATGKVLHTLAQAGRVGPVVFSQNGKRLAAYSYGLDNHVSSYVKIWDLETGKETFSRKVAERDAQVWSMAFNLDGQHLVLSWNILSVELLDTETGETRWSRKNGELYHGVAFSPDGKQIACVGAEKVFVLDTPTGQVQKSFKANGPHGLGRGTPLNTSGVAYLPDGEHVVVSSGVWNLSPIGPAKFDELVPENYDSDSRSSAAFRGDGKRILACSVPFRGARAEISSWDAATGAKKPAFAPIKNSVFAHAFSQNGQRIVFGCWALKGNEIPTEVWLRVWDTEAAKELIAFTVPAATLNKGMAVRADGSAVALTDGKRITIWDAATGAKKQICEEYPRGIGQIAISPDGKRLASCDTLFTSKEMVIWDVATGQPLHSCAVPSDESSKEILCIAFSPDSQFLAAGHGGSGTISRGTGTLTLWNAQTGTFLQTLKGHTASVISLTFSPDSKRMATGGQDQTVRLWDVPTGQEVLAIKLPGLASNVVFSPDGKRLAAFIAYRGVTVWEAP